MIASGPATPPAPPRSAGRRIGGIVLRLGISLVVLLGLLELAAHLFPTLLPVAYRESYPLHGVELVPGGIGIRNTILNRYMQNEDAAEY